MTLARPWTAAAAVTVLAALPACGVFKSNDDAQAIVNQRVIGQTAGSFFDTYGAPKARGPLGDGSVEYSWISPVGATPNGGQYGQDSRTCTLRLVVGKNGRIVTADVVLDNPGRTTTSRCTELFKG